MQNLLEQSFTLQDLVQWGSSHPFTSVAILYLLGVFVIGIPCAKYTDRLIYNVRTISWIGKKI